MARLDRVKNLSGLAEWFATNQRLRKLVNLVIIGESPNLHPLLGPSLAPSPHVPSPKNLYCLPCLVEESKDVVPVGLAAPCKP